jgi:inhibitor of KinA sporulation pathway (predicted exonuclease)
MMAMLQRLGLQHEGRHHSGIDDVKNICNICVELAQRYGATYPKSEISTVKFGLPEQNIKPEFRYLLVLDFEATCVDNAKIEPCN